MSNRTGFPTVSGQGNRRRVLKRSARRNKKGNFQKAHPPWIVPKKMRKNDHPQATAVSRIVHRCQEEAWNEFALDFFDGLFGSDDSLLEVFECLYYMGMPRSVLESTGRLIVDQATEEDLQCLAEYLARATRVPTPTGISQRLVLLQVILSFRQQRRPYTRTPTDPQEVEKLLAQLDPVALWHFILGNASLSGQDEQGNQPDYLWQSGNDEYFFWCWEVRALALSHVAKEEEQRVQVHSTADQVAHVVGMAAVAVELGLNQSTQLVCEGMGHGSEWIKGQLGSPAHKDGVHEDEGEEDPWYLYDDDKASQISSAASSGTETSSLTAGSAGSANAQKTKEGIVHEAYTSYSGRARRAAENARETTQTYVAQWKDVGNQKLSQAAESSRAWATQNVHSDTQHWAYLDAAAKVTLASLGAMGVMTEAVFKNTQVLLDHSTTLAADLIHHKHGPTAASVFEDVSMAVTNVWRAATQVVVLCSPSAWAKVMVRHAGKEQLRKEHVQEQAERQHPTDSPPASVDGEKADGPAFKASTTSTKLLDDTPTTKEE